MQTFNEDQVTFAALLDLEGSFDDVWRDGVIYQLKEAGVTGRLLKYTISFTNRTSRNLVNSHVSEWMNTSVGVPQGSILCLDIIYILHSHYDL